MGDRRFETHYETVRTATVPQDALRDMADGAVVEALAAASRANDPYLANVLATEATNRMRRSRVEVVNLGEGLCSLDMAGRILTANPAAERLLGWSQAELCGQDFDSFCRDGAKVGDRTLRGMYFSVITTGVAVDCDAERFYRRDGSAFDVSYSAAPIVGPHGVEGVVIAFRDVSTRKQAEDALRESEGRYRSLFDNSLDFIVSTDILGRIMAASLSALAKGGYSLSELVGRRFERLAAPESRADARELFRRAIGGQAERKPLALLRADGGKMRAMVLAMPILLDGVIVGIYGIAEGPIAPA
jgi:PAS domain S-box-containing protein